MQKAIRSISGKSRSVKQRASTLALVAIASLLATGAAVADVGLASTGSRLVARGVHLNTDFNQDGRTDNRRFWFHAIEQADGSVTGEAKLRVLVDDLDSDGIPDVEPFVEFVRIRIGGATLIGDGEIFISGVVTASNDPVPCSPADGIFSLTPGTQMGFVVKDNGYGGAADQITPTIIWDCVPFVGSDYGVDDSVSFADWAVDQGFAPFLAQFLVDIEYGDMYVD